MSAESGYTVTFALVIREMPYGSPAFPVPRLHGSAHHRSLGVTRRDQRYARSGDSEAQGRTAIPCVRIRA
jgi:hypothetical protein